MHNFSRSSNPDSEAELWLATTPRSRGDVHAWNTMLFGAVLQKPESCHSSLLNELMQAIMDDVLELRSDWYPLNLSREVRIDPCERQQAPHRGDEMRSCAKDRAGYLVDVMWTGANFTAIAADGATRIWPYSRLDALSRAERAIAAEMPRGWARRNFGSVMHCGVANGSSTSRTGLILSHGRLKQCQNGLLAYSQWVAAKFSKSIRDLLGFLGYRIHGPNLGGYEGHDPDVLFEVESHTGAALDALRRPWRWSCKRTVRMARRLRGHRVDYRVAKGFIFKLTTEGEPCSRQIQVNVSLC